MMTLLSLLLIVIAAAHLSVALYALPPVINIGYLNDESRDGHNLSGLAVMELAEKALHEDGVIPWTTEFKFYHEPITCDFYDGAIGFIKLKQRDNISALMGPPCAEPADAIGRLAVPWNILLLSHGSNAEEFIGKHVYKTFARTSLFSPSQVARALATFISYNKWNRVAIMERTGTAAQNEAASFLVLAMKATFKELKIDVALHITIDDGDVNYDTYLQQIREQARVIIPVFSRSTTGSAEFLLKAYNQGMTSSEYVYIFAEEEADNVFSDHWDYEVLNATARYTLRKAYEAVMVVKLLALGKGRAVKFKTDLENTYTKIFPNRPASDFEYKIYQPPLYDSVYTYGMALNFSISKAIQYNDGAGLFNLLRWAKLPGAVAPVIFDQRVERAPTYVVESFDVFGNWSKLADIERERAADVNTTRFDFDPSTETASETAKRLALADAAKTFSFVVKPARPAHWRTENNVPPLDIPKCGFDGRLCTDKFSIWWLIFGIAGAVFVLVTLGSVYLWMKNNSEKNLMKAAFIIDLEKLRKVSHTGGSDSQGSGTMSGSRSGTNADTMSILSKYSSYSTGKFGFASYDGTPAHVENIKKNRHFVFDRAQLKKLGGFRHVMHENTTPFLGISIDGPQTLVILWQFVSSRSLRDVLHNTDIKLDDDFLSTFLKGVSSGIKYLHRSQLDHHGCLTTQTCLVDSRMVVKLSGYGLTPVLSYLTANQYVIIERKVYDRFHMAPEVLMKYNAGEYTGSKEGDMFSLGMVFYQIITRRELYEDFIITPEEILIKVLAPTTSLMRPEIPASLTTSWGDPVRRAIVQCWEHDPAARPNIDHVCRVISSACKKFSGSIMEKMMDRMERYAANLEKLVVERTAEAREQQKRAETLLMEMLPRSVAERLQAGMTIEPESYEASTVMFTDIYGFDKLSSNSSAMEVIMLLNQLYSAFDDLIGKRDVYKVETIGDVYMLVSGVPNRNQKHIDEILTLAMGMRDFVSQYRLPFGDHGGLQIRMGAHTGPVVTGVIGSKMPRYCLFGDTVNTAARMQSTGIPMKIQVTKAIKKATNDGVKFSMHKRGEVEVKGKGLVTTYFVEKAGTASAEDFQAPPVTPPQGSPPLNAPAVDETRRASVDPAGSIQLKPIPPQISQMENPFTVGIGQGMATKSKLPPVN